MASASREGRSPVAHLCSRLETQAERHDDADQQYVAMVGSQQRSVLTQVPLPRPCDCPVQTLVSWQVRSWPGYHSATTVALSLSTEDVEDGCCSHSSSRRALQRIVTGCCRASRSAGRNVWPRPKQAAIREDGSCHTVHTATEANRCQAYARRAKTAAHTSPVPSRVPESNAMPTHGNLTCSSHHYNSTAKP
jgi:hypothetical protein